VHPSDFARAIQAIRVGGGAEWEYLTHGPAAGEAAPGRTFMHTTGIELDVHRRVRGYAGRYVLPPAGFFDEEEWHVVVQGRALPVPQLPLVILHAMLHLSKGGPSAFASSSTLVDLLWARTRHPVAYREALELAGQTGCQTPAAWADRTVSSWFPLSPAGAAPAEPLTARVQLRAFDRAVRSPFVAAHLHRFVGPYRLRRAWEAALPSPEFRQRHRRSGFKQLRHVVIRIFTGRGAA
jgi:hypothetical protein